jgi:hypothetical protein
MRRAVRAHSEAVAISPQRSQPGVASDGTLRARRQLLAVYSAAVGDISAGIGQWGPACGTWLPQDWEPSREAIRRTDRSQKHSIADVRTAREFTETGILEMVHRLRRAAT